MQGLQDRGNIVSEFSLKAVECIAEVYQYVDKRTCHSSQILPLQNGPQWHLTDVRHKESEQHCELISIAFFIVANLFTRILPD